MTRIYCLYKNRLRKQFSENRFIDLKKKIYFIQYIEKSHRPTEIPLVTRNHGRVGWGKNEKKKRKVDVDMPFVVAQYNHHIGYVDLHDADLHNAVQLSNYRVAIRGRKWWCTLFASGLNCSLVNAWKTNQTNARTRFEGSRDWKQMTHFRVTAMMATTMTIDSSNVCVEKYATISISPYQISTFPDKLKMCIDDQADYKILCKIPTAI